MERTKSRIDLEELSPTPCWATEFRKSGYAPGGSVILVNSLIARRSGEKRVPTIRHIEWATRGRSGSPFLGQVGHSQSAHGGRNSTTWNKAEIIARKVTFDNVETSLPMVIQQLHRDLDESTIFFGPILATSRLCIQRRTVLPVFSGYAGKVRLTVLDGNGETGVGLTKIPHERGVSVVGGVRKFFGVARRQVDLETWDVYPPIAITLTVSRDQDSAVTRINRTRITSNGGRSLHLEKLLTAPQ